MSETRIDRPEQWKSLDDRGGDRDPFAEFIRREYPSQAHKLADPPERREFLKLMGASLALAGVGSSCTRQPKETILPYAKSPESTIPGKPVYYATSMPWPTGSIGILVESHEGRPTKIEGNPDHPASLGATDAITQASILGLYDPDRSKTIQYRGKIRTWDDFLTTLKESMSAQAAKQGAGLRILTETVTSPTLAAQINRLLEKYPEARCYEWDPIHRDNEWEGIRFQSQPRFDQADIVLSLGSDFLGVGPGRVRATRDFGPRRSARGAAHASNRLYVAETEVSLTGSKADHRLSMKPSEIEALARELENRLRFGESPAPGSPTLTHVERWIEVVLKDLMDHRGSSLVVAGPSQSPALHASVASINQLLGNSGKTVFYSNPEDRLPPQTSSPRRYRFGLGKRVEELANLVVSMQRGSTDILVILGGNPAYDAPADLEFERATRRVPLRIHLSLDENETSDLCDWHVNAAHFLEAWSDAALPNGRIGLVQPLIAPLYSGKTAHELVAALSDEAGLSSYEIVRAHWKARQPDGFESWWRRTLHDGIDSSQGSDLIGGSDSRARDDRSSRPSGQLEIAFLPDPTVWDGRFANNGWLQELPKPITKLTWDNAAHVSPGTAASLGVENEDVVELELDGRKVRAPIWIVPGQADQTVVVHLGYGRTKVGRIGEGAGFNAYALRTTKAMWSASGLKVTKTGEKRKLSSTQEHDRMEGRDLVRVATAGYAAAEPAHEPGHEPRHKEEGEGHASLHPPHPKGEYSWGMVIDLASCTGCSACVVACNAENNVPVVGRDQVRRGREMHWIRVDRYFEGDDSAPAVHHQPVTCMHCENAPCEVVCPVGATTHSDEGLNEMAYNRCVGTRYCSNNCPYKVRRFNFYLYQDFETEVTKLQRNPDVSIRSRGVMEKCTYCVQRIQESRIHAEKEGRKIRDGEIRTACQQVCPAEAITFGNIDDPASAVAKQKADPREYGLLEELNVRPRTTYLAKVVNPNPALAHDDEHRAEDKGR